MKYVFRGPTADLKLSEWDLPAVRAALLFRTDEQPKEEQRRSDMLLGQVQKAGEKGLDADEYYRIKVDQASCDTLDRAMGELQGNKNYGEESEQKIIGGVRNRLAWVRSDVSVTSDQDRGKPPETAKPAWVKYSDSIRSTVGGETPVPIAEQVDQANARAKARLTARLAAGNEPVEPRLPGFERPLQLSLSGITGPDSGGRGR